MKKLKIINELEKEIEKLKIRVNELENWIINFKNLNKDNNNIDNI